MAHRWAWSDKAVPGSAGVILEGPVREIPTASSARSTPARSQIAAETSRRPLDTGGIRNFGAVATRWIQSRIRTSPESNRDPGKCCSLRGASRLAAEDRQRAWRLEDPEFRVSGRIAGVSDGVSYRQRLSREPPFSQSFRYGGYGLQQPSRVRGRRRNSRRLPRGWLSRRRVEWLANGDRRLRLLQPREPRAPRKRVGRGGVQRHRRRRQLGAEPR